MDEFAAFRRRARREVIFLDKRTSQTARGCVERDAETGDAAADHQDIEGLSRQLVEDLVAGGGHLPRINVAVLVHRVEGQAGQGFGGCANWHGPWPQT